MVETEVSHAQACDTNAEISSFKFNTDFGKLVYQGKLGSESVNLSNLKSGLYIFRIQENVMKIVKEWFLLKM